MSTHAASPTGASFRPDEPFARELDAADPLACFRAQFHIPSAPDGSPSIYFCGNSLGLQPVTARAAVMQELDDWARLGVEGHFHAAHPWYPYHEELRPMLARLVGAREHEVVAMNSLTVNLHLLMATFYRPTPQRSRIVIEDAAFPSDSYAVASQAAWHALDPAIAIVRLRPRAGEQTLRTADVEAFLAEQGHSVALLLLGAVNYVTGQWFDMDRITAAGHRAGAVVGWDLAHAAGNVPLNLHSCGSDGCDFAAWCSYKYLNSGPGAVAGAFVHERHTRNPALPRLAGWWGNDPATRFAMTPDFVPVPSADAWSLSNPPVLATAPLRASLELFDRAGMAALREKSVQLTGYLARLLNAAGIRVITPAEPSARGCQLSISLGPSARQVHRALTAAGVVCDFREPDVIRVAPVPMYNTYYECWRFARLLEEAAAG